MDDLISRQAAFEALCNAPSRCVDFDVCKKGSRYCAEGTKLDEVPSAQNATTNSHRRIGRCGKMERYHGTTARTAART